MTEFDDKIKEKITALQNKFKNELENKFDEIKIIKGQLIENSFEINDIKLLHSEIHKLTGSSGIFGFMDISITSEKLEFFLKKIINSENTDRADKNNRNYLLEEYFENLEIEIKKTIYIL